MAVVRWTVTITIAVVTAGCAPGDVVRVPFPPLEHGALILGLHRATHDPELTVRAFDVPGPDVVLRIPEEIERDESVLMEALLYAEPLSASLLEEGLLPRAGQEERARALPATGDIYRTMLPDDSPEWELAASASEGLAGFRIADPGPRDCADFSSEPFSLEDGSDTELALVLSSTVVVIGMRSGALFSWTPSGVEEVVVSPPALLSHGVWDEVDRTWWLMSRWGELFTGTFTSRTELRLEPVTYSFPPYEQRYRIALRRERGEPKIYSVRSDGTFQRYDALGVTELYDFGDADFGGHALLTADGQIIAAASGSTSIVRISSDGEQHVESVPTGAGFTAAAYVDGLGVVLGSADGQFFSQAGAAWRALGASPLTVFPFAIAPYRGGFLYAGAFGAGGQYLPDGYCAVEDHLAAYSVQHLVPVRDGFLALGQNPNTPQTPGQLVRLAD